MYKNVTKCKYNPNPNPSFHEKEKSKKFRMIKKTRRVCSFNWAMESKYVRSR